MNKLWKIDDVAALFDVSPEVAERLPGISELAVPLPTGAKVRRPWRYEPAEVIALWEEWKQKHREAA